eukprot:scaffold3795_cov126-Isochrysis_galbana.AAC.14
MAGNLDGDRAQLHVLGIGESLRRSDDDRVAGVDPERVEVLHVAHSDAVVIAVAHNLVLDLFPALHRLLNQHLRRVGQRLRGEFARLLLVVREARAEATQREGGAHDDRVADLGTHGHGFVNGRGRVALGHLLVDLCQLLVEEVAVLVLGSSLSLREVRLAKARADEQVRPQWAGG